MGVGFEKAHESGLTIAETNEAVVAAARAGRGKRRRRRPGEFGGHAVAMHAGGEGVFVGHVGQPINWSAMRGG